MSNEQSFPPIDGHITIKIDIEELFKKGDKHPNHDPGVIFIYIYKVDEERYEIRHQKLTGRQILENADKDVCKVRLFQLKREHGHIHKVEIGLDTMVNLIEEGIEKFVTEPITYLFFIGPKEYSTYETTLTVKEILVDFAKVNPENYTLAKKIEGGFHEYKNMDEVVPLKDCPHFVIFDNCPTQVS